MGIQVTEPTLIQGHLGKSVQSALVHLTARGLESAAFIIQLKVPCSPILIDWETEVARSSSLSKVTWLKVDLFPS